MVVLALGGLAVVPGLLSRLSAAPAGSTGASPVRIGFRDASGPGKMDQVILLASGGEKPQVAPGTEYNLWLVRGDENRRNAGAFQPRDGELQLTYNDPATANLLGTFDSAEITIEPANRPANSLPSDQVAARGSCRLSRWLTSVMSSCPEAKATGLADSPSD